MATIGSLVVALAVSSCGVSDDGGGGSAPASTSPVTTSPVVTAPATMTPVTDAPVTAIPQTTGPVGASDCPVVVAAELVQTSPGVFTVSATVRSVDVEDVSYADAWEIRDMDGNVLGTRVLTHPHANEQPFTRSLSGVLIPAEVSQAVVDARDSVRGYCGVSLIVEVPHS